jgi:serpin B
MAVVVQSAPALGQDVRALTKAYNASGQALFEVLARTPGNIVISPYSIGAAMAMARAGARGETERQMAKVLKHALPPEATDAANAALLASLNAYDRSAQPGFCPQDAQWTGTRCEAPLSSDRRCPPSMLPEDQVCVGHPVGPSARLISANALMLARRGGLISAEFKALVGDKYAAGVFEGAGLEEVNAWVREKTQGKIERILDRLDPDAAAVLLNAVYLKAAWASPFSKGATREDDFNLTARQKVRVPMMRQQAPFPVVERAGFRAIRLAYIEPSLAMVVVLPNEVEGLAAVSERLDAGEVANLASTLRKGPHSLVALALPRFKAAYNAGLVKPFQTAGMTLAFGDSADFSGMTGRTSGRDGVKIGDIEHRAVIEVAEPGTEAAAATAVVMVPARSAPREPPRAVPFVVDRPFLFYVVDDASGAILFQGRIADPRQS